MDDREFSQLRSDVIQLQQDRNRLQSQVAYCEQAIAALQRTDQAQARWSLRVTSWIREHVGGHTSAVTEEIDSWLKGQA